MGTPGRLLIGYVLVIVIMAVSGFLIVGRMASEMKRSIVGNARTLATTLMGEVDLAIGARVHSLEVVAGTHLEIRKALVESNRNFTALGSDAAIQANIDAADRAWRAAPQDDPTPFMQGLMANDLSESLLENMRFHERIRGHPVFGEIFVTNRYGANAGQTGRTSDYRQDDEVWWQVAWDRGLWLSNDVSFDESAGMYSVDVGLRVSDGDGEPLGVMKAVMNIAVLRDIVDGFSERSHMAGVFVEVVDGTGHLIHRQGDPASFGEDLSQEPAVRRVLQGEEAAAEEDAARGRMLRAFVRSRPLDKGGPSLNWSLILNQPIDVVYAPLHDLERWMIGVAILGALAAALVGVLLSLSFGRMTRRLTETSVALKESEGRNRSIVTNVVDGIISIRFDGQIRSVNPAVEEVFGYTADEVLGQNVKMLMPEPYHSEHDGYLRRFLETGEARVIGSRRELRGLRKDGSEFPLELAIGEIHHGDERAFVGIVRDVTERHEALQSLQDAKEAAEVASRSKGQFLANMSHELRTPLNAIIGYAEMVVEELEEQDAGHLASDVQKIRSAGAHLLGLINDILDVSKIEAGRMELYLETFDLGPFLEQVASTVKPLMANEGNELVLDTEPARGPFHTDVTKVRQILFNLLSNAAKFTRNGQVTLSAHRDTDEQAEWIEFRVIDTGIGMTPEQIDRVWDAFSQADASTTRQFGGTGLGLTITRSFCDMLGGTIDIASTHGEGTTFTVRLPALTADETAAAQAPPAADALLSADTVLVIDDDPATRDLVQRFLNREGIDVLSAANGEEGLRLAAEVLPSAIVLDVMMPGMDGWAVLSSLKSDALLRNIPVVMLTMVDERQMGMALGCDAYLTKPVDRATLAECVAQYVHDPGQHTVLVVEDDEDARSLIARALRVKGWEVLEAEHGAAALELLERATPDLILLDLMMPVLDGFEVVDRLQRHEQWRDIPVIVLSSKDITKEDAARLESAVLQTVQKGAFSREILLNDIGRHVRRALLKKRGRTGSASDSV